MKKTLIILGCMGIGFTHAQQQGREHTQHTGATKRVGINTEKPVASFEVSKVNNIPATQVQGFLLPHLSQTERNAMQKEALTNGLMIFNTSKNCIDWWDGTNWQCINGTQRDEHGEEYGSYKATVNYTATAEFQKNNCSEGRIGNTVKYTNPTPIVGKGVSNISQEDAERIAEENAKAEFNRLGQIYANSSTCFANVRTACTNIHWDSYIWTAMGGSLSDPKELLFRKEGLLNPDDMSNLISKSAETSFTIVEGRGHTYLGTGAIVYECTVNGRVKAYGTSPLASLLDMPSGSSGAVSCRKTTMPYGDNVMTDVNIKTCYIEKEAE